MRTKQQVINGLTPGIYWLVNFGNGWYASRLEPKRLGKFLIIEKIVIS